MNEKIQKELDEELIIAADKGNVELVKSLVKKGADLRAQDDKAFVNAACNKDLPMIKYLVENGVDAYKNDRLFINICSGSYEVFKYLIKNGANIHAQNDYLLTCAIYSGALDRVRFLVEHGADIYARNNLITAACNNNLEVLQYLIVECGYKPYKALKEAKEEYRHSAVEWLEQYIKLKEIKEQLEIDLSKNFDKIKVKKTKV